MRRPGLLLSALGVAALLLLLPDLCGRAVGDSQELALQVGVSTLATFLSLVGGFAGLRASARDGDLGAAPEWLASPLGLGAYTLGRLAGALAACTVLLVVLALFLVPGQADQHAPSLVSAGLCASGVLLTALQFASIGFLLGSATTPQLAAILFAVTLVATRTVVPELVGRGGALSHVAAVLPDPARLDLSREVAFRRPVDLVSAATACAAAFLHATAVAAAAVWFLRRREA